MEVRSRVHKLPTIGDENVDPSNNMAVNKVKMNPTKAPTEKKRATLGDLAANKMHARHVPTTTTSVAYKSKLPVFKPGLARTKSVLETKSRIAPSKEVPTLNKAISKPALNTLVNKTKSLKIETLRQSAKQVSVAVDKNELSKVDRPFGVEDIDRKDYGNPFLVAAYANDIQKYLRMLEQRHPIRENYLKDRSITPKMRSILIDWLVEVQQEYSLLPETLHIAVGILDTYLQNKPDVSRHHMQLIGVTALFLASKYEEIMVPSAEELVYVSASAFKEAELYEMERQVFRTIDFDLSRPISLTFLRRYSKVGYAQALQHSFAKYFLELALVEYTLCHVHPSLIAAAALCLAFFVTDERNPEVIDESLWTPTLEFYSDYKVADIAPTAKILARLAFNAKSSEYKAVYQKYSKSKFLKVSGNSVLFSSRIRELITPTN